MFHWSEFIDPKQVRRLLRARSQPALCFLDIDVSELLRELLTDQFAGVTCDVRASFVSEGVWSKNSAELKVPHFTRFTACQILPSQPYGLVSYSESS